MSKGTVRVRGADRVARTMGNAAEDLETMDDGVREYTQLLAGTARRYSPVKTGKLRSSIGAQGTQVAATVRYAAPVNARTGFMTRAVKDTEGDADRIFTADAAHICDQITGA